MAAEKEMMKLDSDAKGVYVIAPTPFHPDGKIDDASIDQHALGRFPWSRDKWALVIDELSLARPKVIALDVIFPDVENEENDRALAAAFARAGNVLLGANLSAWLPARPLRLAMSLWLVSLGGQLCWRSLA